MLLRLDGILHIWQYSDILDYVALLADVWSLKLGSQYDAGASVVSQALGWHCNRSLVHNYDAGAMSVMSITGKSFFTIQILFLISNSLIGWMLANTGDTTLE